MDKKICSIGGQALIEGVMMLAPRRIAMAVRKESGEIVTKCEDYTPPREKNKFLGLPLIRGCVSFVESLKIGMTSMNFASSMIEFEDEEPSKFEIWLSKKLGKGVDQIVIGVAMVLAVFLSVGLFIALPSFLGSLLGHTANSVWVTNIIEGVSRITIFVLYLVLISKMKDIKRVFMYHGAEHKTIACYENGLDLSIENARGQTRFHPRCGTNFLFLVMIVSILFFSLVGFNGSWLTKIGLKILCLPIVAGISYEVLKFAAKYDNIVTKIIKYPGMLLQKLTTKEPDDSMLEVAITSFNLALNGEPCSDCDIVQTVEE